MRIPVCKEFKQKANRPDLVADIFRAILKSESEIDQDKEHFWVMGCDTRLNVKFIDLVSLGTLDASLVHPREVFRLAIQKGVSAIVVAHNHTSGETYPSPQDIDVTKRLRDAGRILGIQLLDHIIVGDSYYSFADNHI